MLTQIIREFKQAKGPLGNVVGKVYELVDKGG